MPNKNFNNVHGGFPSQGPSTGKSGSSSSVPMRCPDWPGVIGKTQKDRSNGVKKIAYVKSVGL